MIYNIYLQFDPIWFMDNFLEMGNASISNWHDIVELCKRNLPITCDHSENVCYCWVFIWYVVDFAL